MVRINLIHPKHLSDQHLRAEYNEILQLFGHTKKHPKPKKIPEHYILGTGHINFFKNKLKYLKKRFDKTKKEMIKRGFNANKSITISRFPQQLCNDWRPRKEDKELIKKRLSDRIKKPKKIKHHTYYREKHPKHFFLEHIKMG